MPLSDEQLDQLKDTLKDRKNLVELQKKDVEKSLAVFDAKKEVYDEVLADLAGLGVS